MGIFNFLHRKKDADEIAFDALAKKIIKKGKTKRDAERKKHIEEKKRFLDEKKQRRTNLLELIKRIESNYGKEANYLCRTCKMMKKGGFLSFGNIDADGKWEFASGKEFRIGFSDKNGIILQVIGEAINKTNKYELTFFNGNIWFCEYLNYPMLYGAIVRDIITDEAIEQFTMLANAFEYHFKKFRDDYISYVNSEIEKY